MNPTAPPRVVLATGQFLALVREGHWEYTERLNATGAAIILAVTPAGNLLLVEQYRIPCHARTLELPGTTGESHAEAARRELLEETGYAAELIEPLTFGPASSGVTSELVTLFHASRLRRVGVGGGVGHEAIVVQEVPLDQVEEWLAQKAAAGVLVDPKVFTGLYFLERLNRARQGDLKIVDNPSNSP
jgi:ADP-ribose pyrophosphatase